MSIAGHNVTFDGLLKEEDGWWDRYTMTQEQRYRWNKESIQLLRTKLRWPKWRAEDQMTWIELMWGLKISH